MSAHTRIRQVQSIMVVMLLAALPVVGWAQPTQNELQKLIAVDSAPGDLFGCAVAISGDTAVVGAYDDDDNGTNSGSAFVFVWDGSSWIREAKLLASDGEANDYFGRAVDIAGDTIVIGAPPMGYDSGAAYVFVQPVGGWSGTLTEDAKLLGSDAGNMDRFGRSVAITEDIIVVGSEVPMGGAAYVFLEPGGGWSGTLNENAKLTAYDATAVHDFSCSVAISGDTIVIGAQDDDEIALWAGAAYVFVEPVGGWSGYLNEDAKLLPSDGVTRDNFGYSVAIFGDTVAVGSIGDDDLGNMTGSAYVYVKPVGGWDSVSSPINEDAKLLASDGTSLYQFGRATAVSADTIVVRSSGDTFVFLEPVGGWDSVPSPINEDAELVPSDGTVGGDYGRSVAISGDIIMIGGPYDDCFGSNTGSAYMFEKGAGWVSGSGNQVAKLFPWAVSAGDYFGYSVALFGNTAVVGAYGDDKYGNLSGAAYVYVWDSESWIIQAKLQASDAADGDQFGKYVAISGDSVVVGAGYDDDSGTDSGSAYVFNKPPGGWAGTLNEDAKLLASDGAGYDHFGICVAMTADSVVVGASSDDDNGSASGSAYVFDKPPGGWTGTLTEDAKLLASDGAASDQLGYSLAISADTIVVGAYGNDDGGSTSGSAYIFVKPGGGWAGTLNEDAKLLASDAIAYGYFGYSVAISGDTVAIGSYGDDDNGSYSGSVYMFVKPGGGWTGTLNENAKLLSSDGAASDYVGKHVAIYCDKVVTGAYGDDDNGSQSGSAYIFDEPGGGWSGILNEDAKLLPTDGAEDDVFGLSVAIFVETIVVGAQFDDVNGSNSGSAYVFGYTTGDLNGDGSLNSLDIDPFTLALTATPPDYLEYYAQFPDGDHMLADANYDGTINSLDIDPFVALLTGG